MALHLNSLRLSVRKREENTFILTDRLVAHTECATKTLQVTREELSKGSVSYCGFIFTSKGYDCGFDNTCPFCGEHATEGEELLVSKEVPIA